MHALLRGELASASRTVLGRFSAIRLTVACVFAGWSEFLRHKPRAAIRRTAFADFDKCVAGGAWASRPRLGRQHQLRRRSASPLGMASESEWSVAVSRVRAQRTSQKLDRAKKYLLPPFVLDIQLAREQMCGVRCPLKPMRKSARSRSGARSPAPRQRQRRLKLAKVVKLLEHGCVSTFAGTPS